MKWKKLEAGNYESQNNWCDFSVMKQNGEWALDIFDSNIKDIDAAYIESFSCPTLKAAKEEAIKYRK